MIYCQKTSKHDFIFRILDTFSMTYEDICYENLRDKVEIISNIGNIELTFDILKDIKSIELADIPILDTTNGILHNSDMLIPIEVIDLGHWISEFIVVDSNANVKRVFNSKTLNKLATSNVAGFRMDKYYNILIPRINNKVLERLNHTKDTTREIAYFDYVQEKTRRYSRLRLSYAYMTNHSEELDLDIIAENSENAPSGNTEIVISTSADHLSGIKRIKMPRNIEDIHRSTFETLINLEEVECNNVAIDMHAFIHNPKLHKFKANIVYGIEREAFYGCKELSVLDVQRINIIYNDALVDTRISLEDILKAKPLSIIGRVCSVYPNKVVIPKSVHKIGIESLLAQELKEVYFESRDTRIIIDEPSKIFDIHNGELRILSQKLPGEIQTRIYLDSLSETYSSLKRGIFDTAEIDGRPYFIIKENRKEIKLKALGIYDEKSKKSLMYDNYTPIMIEDLKSGKLKYRDIVKEAVFILESLMKSSGIFSYVVVRELLATSSRIYSEVGEHRYLFEIYSEFTRMIGFRDITHYDKLNLYCVNFGKKVIILPYTNDWLLLNLEGIVKKENFSPLSMPKYMYTTVILPWFELDLGLMGDVPDDAVIDALKISSVEFYKTEPENYLSQSETVNMTYLKSFNVKAIVNGKVFNQHIVSNIRRSLF